MSDRGCLRHFHSVRWRFTLRAELNLQKIKFDLFVIIVLCSLVILESTYVFSFTYSMNDISEDVYDHSWYYEKPLLHLIENVPTVERCATSAQTTVARYKQPKCLHIDISAFNFSNHISCEAMPLFGFFWLFNLESTKV